MNFPTGSNRLYFTVLSVVLALIGFEATVTTEFVQATGVSMDTHADGGLMAQAACPYEYQDRQPYARVVTQRDPLLVRATPGGSIIGAIPKGWAVVTLERNSNGQWTRITSHFGNIDDYPFGSAPHFRDGWVATRYLDELGEFCEKPMAMVEGALVVHGQTQQYLANEDWLQLGDRIALVQP